MWGDSNSRQQRALGRTMFLDLANMFTIGQLKRKSSVDYAVGVLLYGKCTTLENIVEKEVRDISIRNNLRTKLIVVINFIKFGARNHIAKDDDRIHDVNYAVLSGNQGRFGTAVVSKCGYCLIPIRTGDNRVIVPSGKTLVMSRAEFIAEASQKVTS